jgi:WhiB family redox-sensing transcriptional regulator
MVVTQLPAQRAALEEERRDWWRTAACREADPELFFPVTAEGPGAGEAARAKAVCAGCLVRRQCLQYALATHQLHGVWGGTTEDERHLRVRGERERERRGGPGPVSPTRAGTACGAEEPASVLRDRRLSSLDLLQASPAAARRTRPPGRDEPLSS